MIDRHLEFGNVWPTGSGSGHGFKRGLVRSEYVAARILDGGSMEPHFMLAAKEKGRRRAVY